MKRKEILRFLIFICAGFILSDFASAQQRSEDAKDVFTIANIGIEAKAQSVNQSANEVKNQALIQAKWRAFQSLISRLAIEGERTELPDIDISLLDRLIRDISFQDEKFGGGIYRANVTIRFAPAPIRTLLNNHQIQFSEVLGPELLVIPFLNLGASNLLWQQDNPLFSAWQDALSTPQVGLVHLRLPELDKNPGRFFLADDLMRKLRAPLEYDVPNQVQMISDQFGADGVLFVIATLRQFGVSDIVEIELIPDARGWQQPALPLKFDRQANETRQSFLNRISFEIIEKTNEIWKTRTFIRSDDDITLLRLRANLGSFEAWRELQEMFSSITGIQSMVVQALRRDQVWLDIYQLGGVEQFKASLAGQGYWLRPLSGPIYDSNIDFMLEKR